MKTNESKELTDDEKVKGYMFSASVSQITLVQTNQIIEQYLWDSVESEFDKMGDDKKKRVLEVVEKQGFGNNKQTL